MELGVEVHGFGVSLQAQHFMDRGGAQPGQPVGHRLQIGGLPAQQESPLHGGVGQGAPAAGNEQRWASSEPYQTTT
ncbi:hypothetical protein AB0I94_28470 [Streptomyces sp. NPDC050147]|uniref:hypothetical protein n=1 Tax=Streptomyces sp. NPDC050147 TaxID=3155513 RepID=UPI003429823E